MALMAIMVQKIFNGQFRPKFKENGIGLCRYFYHHRPDPNTPLEETMAALHLMVQQGKALYVGISSYPPAEAEKAFQLLQQIGTHCLIHQPRYSMLDRWVEDGLLDVLEKWCGLYCIFTIGTRCFNQ